MAKRAKHDVAFNIERAIAALHKAALSKEAIPEDDFRSRAIDPVTQRPFRDDPFHVAWAHVVLHGIQATGPRCTLRPCGVGGLCFALHEIVTYQAEHTILGVVAEETERFAGVLTSAARVYAPSLINLRDRVKQRHKQEAAAGLMAPLHAHETLCLAPDRIDQQIRELRSSLKAFSADTRALLESTELGQASDRKRSTLLLTAVYQHLRWGGFTYREIAKLVPDELSERGMIRRIKSRAVGEDARSFHPVDP